MADYAGEYSNLVDDGPLQSTFPFLKVDRPGILASSVVEGASPGIREEPDLPRSEP